MVRDPGHPVGIGELVADALSILESGHGDQRVSSQIQLPGLAKDGAKPIHTRGMGSFGDVDDSHVHVALQELERALRY